MVLATEKKDSAEYGGGHDYDRSRSDMSEKHVWMYL